MNKQKRLAPCLVTGGAGFIGSHVVDALVAFGHGVAVMDNLSTGKRENVHRKASFYNIDIQSPAIERVFEKERPQFVFHYAAQVSVRKSLEDPAYDAKVNILGSLNVLEHCRKYKVKKIIFASSGGTIYGNAAVIPTPESAPSRPLSPYGIAKLTVEHYLEHYERVSRLPFVSLRFANVYGPRQDSRGEAGVIAIFSGALLSGRQPIIFGTGRQTRDFVFVEDAVWASLLALETEKTGVFNVGTRKETSVNEIFARLKAFTNSPAKKQHGPLKSGEASRSCLSFEKIQRELGWTPRWEIPQGLQKTVEFFVSEAQKLRKEIFE